MLKLYRVVLAVMTPGRFLPPNQKQVPTPETPRQAVGEDAVASLKPLFKENTYRCNDREPIRRYHYLLLTYLLL